MASEYIKWKSKDIDVKTEEEELTPEEKRKNWWYYHKWYLIIGVIALIALVHFLLDIFGVGEAKPDYQIAYVGSDPLPDETVYALETAISEMGQDLNGDGQVVVVINQYATYENIIQTQKELEELPDGDLATQAQLSYAKLMTDISVNDSFFFLLEDPEGFEERYKVLSYLDGSLPDEENADYRQMCITWSDSQLLSSMDLGEYDLFGTTGSNQELLSRLYIARRGFWTGKTCKHLEGCEALWMRILEEVQ